METPKVVVLILSYNGKPLLEDSVDSYLKNNYPNFEVVVIDNGSSDDTKEYVETNFPEAKVIRIEKNRGYSGGFNFGLNHAFNDLKADYVVITNNDVKADENVISALTKVAVQDDTIGFVTGKVYYFDYPDTLQTVGKYEDSIYWNGRHMGLREKDSGQFDQVAERHFIDDVFMLVSKKLYFEVGDYDTTFFIQSEEYDWMARAKDKGYKIMYTPEAKIWHKESMTIGKRSALKAYFDSRNPMLVILKHKSPDFFRKFFWYHFKRTVFRYSLIKVKKFHFKSAFKIWQGFLSGVIWGFRNKLFTRKHFFR